MADLAHHHRLAEKPCERSSKAALLCASRACSRPITLDRLASDGCSTSALSP